MGGQTDDKSGGDDDNGDGTLSRTLSPSNYNYPLFSSLLINGRSLVYLLILKNDCFENDGGSWGGG